MLDIDLHKHLNKIYDIICFVDLAEITKSPSAVFKLFRDCYKEAYAPNERLILYSDQHPSNKLLTHIQKAASIFDISNDFILICCPHDIANLLVDIGKKYKFITPIQNNVVDLSVGSKLTDDFYIADTVCSELWSHLEIDTKGNIHPCCVQTDIVGSLREGQIIDVFHSNAMSELRNNMLNGIQVSGCDHCWVAEKNGHFSNRQRHLKLNAKEFYTEWIDNPAIRSLDIKPSNVCNFKCRICGPNLSSLYAAEVLNYAVEPSTIIKIKNDMLVEQWTNTDLFSSQLDSWLPHLTNLDLYGGEPFLVKQLPIVLQKAIDLDVAKNIRLHFNSNGSVFPKKLIPLFDQFKEIDIALSIDNVGNRFELERGGKWKDIEQNVINFMSLQKHNVRVYLYPTINIQNVLYFEELLDWANQIEIELIYNILKSPQYLSIDNMTPQAKQLVIDQFVGSEHEFLTTIANQVRNSKGSDGTEFVQKMKEYDCRRSENFLLTHKEIACAMGYVL
jgi:MoaA/NifB/PqqE/SkfB family radical SAM enzyme